MKWMYLFLIIFLFSCSDNLIKDDLEKYFVDDWSIVEKLIVYDDREEFIQRNTDTLVTSFYSDGSAQQLRSDGVLLEYNWSHLEPGGQLLWVSVFGEPQPGLTLYRKDKFNIACLENFFRGSSINESIRSDGSEIRIVKQWEATRIE